MSTMVSAVFLPAGVDVEPQPMLVTDYTDLQNAVGGRFDVVSTNMNMDDVSIIGYVNDEGILLGMEMNYLATNLFQRELFGDCVVVWGLNEDGEYDGENHDIPSSVYEFLTKDLLLSTAHSYNMAAMMAYACQYAVEQGYATTQEVMDVSREYYNATTEGREVDPETASKMSDIMDWFSDAMENLNTEGGD